MVETPPRELSARSLRANETKRRMIEAAIAVFSERGYKEATTRELAERAGVSEGLIYRHFGGKRELLFAALEAEREKGLDEVERDPSETGLEGEIIHHLRRGVTHMWQRREFTRVCMSLAAIDPELGRLVETIGEQAERGAEALLQRLQDEGLVAADVDIEAAAVCLHMLILGMGYYWQVMFNRDHAAVDERLVHIARQFSRSLVVRNPQTAP